MNQNMDIKTRPPVEQTYFLTELVGVKVTLAGKKIGKIGRAHV